jgi:hypothetical protein
MKILRCVVLRTVLMGAGLGLSSLQADDRAAVPSKEEISKAEALVRDLFKAEYARTKTSDRLALAAKLLEQAKETKEEPAARYVLLREARDIAARAGDVTVAMDAADEIAGAYQVNTAAMRAATADRLVSVITTTTAATTLTDILLASAAEARSTDDFDGELALLKVADSAALKTRSVSLMSTVRARRKAAETFKSESDKVKAHLETLKTTPDDPAANLAVGRFRCLFKNDWPGGLANLAKGSDEKLKEAAEKDKQAAEGGDTEQLAAGDSWYDLAAKADPAVKAALQGRAHHWYSGVVANLTGLAKTRIEKRIEELAAATEARGDKVAMWAGIRKAIADKEIKKWFIVGGGFHRKEFTEIPEAGGILIGFYYSTASGGKYPGGVQPIWQTAGGEVKGKAYGTVERGAKVEVTRAKPGYAVGAIYVRGGGGFDQFKPIYMRIKGGGVDPEDKYEGPQVGGFGGNEGTVGGDGNFIIGLHGKLTDKNAMGAMSVVTLTVKVGEDKPK